MPAPQFKLNQVHKIVAKMAGQDTMQVSQMNVGGKRPAKDWVAMEMVELLWVVKWTGTGLMPVSPWLRSSMTLLFPRAWHWCLQSLSYQVIVMQRVGAARDNRWPAL